MEKNFNPSNCHPPKITPIPLRVGMQPLPLPHGEEDIEKLKEQISDLNRAVQEIKELLIPLMVIPLMVSRSNSNNKIEINALAYVH